MVLRLKLQKKNEEDGEDLEKEEENSGKEEKQKEPADSPLI